MDSENRVPPQLVTLGAITRSSRDARDTAQSRAKPNANAIFYQLCEVRKEKVQVRSFPRGNIITNPSDPDATLDGPKGS